MPEDQTSNEVFRILSDWTQNIESQRRIPANEIWFERDGMRWTMQEQIDAAGEWADAHPLVTCPTCGHTYES